MTLRNQLNNVKIQNSETIQYYFTRVAQIKEQLEAVEENVKEGEIVITTLNGLPRSWDSFIQGICAKRRLVTFHRLREECTQEEARLVTREEKMGATEDQALTVHTRNNFNKKEKKDKFYHNKKQDKKQNNIKRYPSNVQFYTCDEKGHFARDCPIKKKRHHAHVSEDDEPTNKRSRRRLMIQMKSMC